MLTLAIMYAAAMMAALCTVRGVFLADSAEDTVLGSSPTVLRAVTSLVPLMCTLLGWLILTLLGVLASVLVRMLTWSAPFEVLVFGRGSSITFVRRNCIACFVFYSCVMCLLLAAAHAAAWNPVGRLSLDVDVLLGCTLVIWTVTFIGAFLS
jgi:hypothetical protein